MSLREWADRVLQALHENTFTNLPMAKTREGEILSQTGRDKLDRRG